MAYNRRAALVGTLALAACFGHPALAQPSAIEEITPLTDLGSLKALLDARLTATRVPALAVAVFNADRFLLEAAIGLRRAGSADEITTHDVWHLGSCTKAMTAALYARLVDLGLAEWNVALPSLFPDLAAGFDPAWRNITIDQVFAHRAGLSNLDAVWLYERRNDANPVQVQRTATARDWLSKPPKKKVGEYLYSNIGYVIAGAAIERITKGSWEDAMREHLFQPLKMASAGFGPPQGSAPQGHRSGILGGLTPAGAGPLADNPAVVGPAGTVHASLSDWAKFARVFIDPKQTFLKPETVSHLVTPAPGEDYSCGWGVYPESLGGRIYSHVGSNSMWITRITLQPDRGIGSLVACNAESEAATRPIGRSLMAAVRSGAIR